MSIFKPINNKNDNIVYKELKDSIYNKSEISMISAYFSMYAYYVLKEKMDNINNMRIILNPNIYFNTQITNKTHIEEYLHNFLFGTPFENNCKNELNQAYIAYECAKWLNNKVEIKAYEKPNLAQTRLLHVHNQKVTNISIEGSIDFTTASFGISPSNRNDYNHFMTNVEYTNNILCHFNELWNNNLIDIKENVLNLLEKMYKNYSPELLYYITLYNIFSENVKELNEDTFIKNNTSFKQTKIWNYLYNFQKDAVMGALEKIEKYNGCILADSVGLGKTFTALAVIKYYELRNYRVLVLVPKKLRDNWTIYTLNDVRNILYDDKFRYDVLNHTDLNRSKGKSGEIDLKTINWGNYDLVVIDESHNFRNNSPVKGHITRYQRLMQDIIKNGNNTKVLMLTATPVNNRMNDIKNQIAFITKDDDHALRSFGIWSISSTLRKAQEKYNIWSEFDNNKKTQDSFVDMMDLNYFKLLDLLTIARSRKHIEKYYGIEEFGDFPERQKPINLSPEVSNTEPFKSLTEVYEKINELKLSIFSPFLYILDEKKEDYAEKYDEKVQSGNIFKQVDRDENLIGLMRTNLLKRMESSIESFRLTVYRLIYKIDKVLKKIDKGIECNPKLDINFIDPDEEEYDELMFGKNKKVLYQDLNLDLWKKDLIEDKIKLKFLLDKSNLITTEKDRKLQCLKQQIKEKIENPINNDNKKIIIFTAFVDTAQYLYNNLSDWIYSEFNLHSALIVGSNQNKTNLTNVHVTDANDILINFSPISKQRKTINPNVTDEIDILICTDCISEGQNLQDCDYLINYDIHWNPVRIIQRFGRVDRIGSKNNKIQLVNFWPNIELDEYINLKRRVESKMVMVNVSTTGKENIISTDDKEQDLIYRENQLKQLKEEVIDLEDMNLGISITDFTFNNNKIELMNYMKEEHKENLESIPPGIHAIVPMNTSLNKNIAPGVIFLLRQLEDNVNEEDNLIYPYYLIYITENGVVELNYTQFRKIMTIYKELCTGQKDICNNLISEFNQETNNGKNMERYSRLYEKSIKNIGEKNVFEVITFLIIK